MLYKPAYYDAFQCTAADCPCNCCHDWEISVDPETAERWRSRPLPEGMAQVRQRTRTRRKGNTVRYMDGLLSGSHKKGRDRHIIMNPDGRCPFQDERGLCRIVLTYGDDMLSRTCQTYPREIRTFKGTEGIRHEYTLASGCPTLLDLLWMQDVFLVKEFPEAESFPGGQAGSIVQLSKSPFGGEIPPDRVDCFLLIRSFFLDLAADPVYSPRTALKLMFFALTDLIALKERKGRLTESMIRTYFQDTDFAQAAMEVVKADWAGSPMSMSEHNALFQDISVEYRKKKIYTDFLEPLAHLSREFSAFDENGDTADSFAARQDERDWEKLYADFHQEARVYEKHFRLLLCNEIYSELVLPETEFLEDLMMKLEWMALECAVFQHSLFLTFVKNGFLSYESVRECVYIIIRMTGYADDDIREYMENSFDDILWPGWYFNEIV